jgi:MFS-type transporter involved in bile tolerance (Atg22 family)
MGEGTHSHTNSDAKRTRLAWYAYDFGNTSIEFAIPFYLTPWIVNDLGVSAVVFGLASAASSWAIGLSGPYIGVHADEKRRRRTWFTVSALIAAILLASLNILPGSSTAGIIAVLVAAVAANYFFQLSSLVYNASMLNAAGNANVVSVSALGMALSYLGGIVGVGVIQLFMSERLVADGFDRGWALFPAAAVFLLCTIPSIFAKRLWRTEQSNLAPNAKTADNLHHRMMTLWRASSQQYKVGWFLGGYFALNSAIMGLSLYLTLHIQSATGLEGLQLWSVLLAVVLSSAAGAGTVAALRPDGRRVKQIVMAGLTLWAVNAIAFSVVSSFAIIVLCSCLHGLFSGVLVPTVRGAFARTFDSDYQALAFGLFGAVQRLSQGLGAALWPLAGAAASGQRASTYGIAAMGLVALIGVPLSEKWHPPT